MNNNILLEFKKHVQLEKVNKNYTIGTVTLLIYSKENFKNNKDIISFLSDVFDESYLPYVIKSRTLVAAKLGRALAKKEEKSFGKIDKSILAYFESTILDDSNIIDESTILDDSNVVDESTSLGDSNIIENSRKSEGVKKIRKTKKKNANDKLDSWLRGL
ncbi:TPA: hypothetical protein QCY25_003798 [Bacillus toyonensis]|nr:hypothetical protein [Bacillus toyonensis]